MSKPRSVEAQETSQFSRDPSVRHKVIIDTDIGDDIDDALALALALHSPELDVLAVTTVFGDTQLRAHLAAHLLQTFGKSHIPVAPGIEMPLQIRHAPSGVAQAAILDRRSTKLLLSDCDGPDLIRRAVLAHPGQVTLLCLGPLTNVATALRREPRLFLALRRIILMGGTVGLPCPEWNVRSDARAAQTVLASGAPITLLGWNVTRRCQLTPPDLQRLHQCSTPEARLLSLLIAIWQRHRPRWYSPLPYLHDPLTITALCAPHLLTFEEIPVRVLTRGPFQGFMVPRLMNGPLVHAATQVNASAARAWIMQRLLDPMC